jgi:hypothetical protein
VLRGGLAQHRQQLPEQRTALTGGPAPAGAECRETDQPAGPAVGRLGHLAARDGGQRLAGAVEQPGQATT